MTQRTHRNALQTGHLLHWYRIDSVLGQGGFGITYLAHDTNLDHHVAIKEFLPTEMAMREPDQSVHPTSQDMDERFRWGLDRFVAEARTLARFQHPSIVRVLSVFEANNTAYMVMELEHGETLQQRLSRERTLPEAEIRALLKPLLEGLEAVHAAGFVHRDIKPANIIVRKGGAPVLIDFGSARQAIGQYTRTLTTLISPGYAPYEQYLSGGDRQGPWTDIYSLAATFYRCVVGRPPIDALDRSEGLLKSERDAYMPAIELGEGNYSAALLRAIDHGMRFKAAERPQTVAAWRREFAGEVDEPVTRIASAGDEPRLSHGVGAQATPSVPVAAGMKSSINAPSMAASEANTKVAPGVGRMRPHAGHWLLVLGVLISALAIWKWYAAHEASALNDQPAAITPAADATNATQSAASKEPALPGSAVGMDPAVKGEPPAALDPEVVKRSMLQEASVAVTAAQANAGTWDTAVRKYRQVLDLDPINVEAHAALTSIAVALAKNSLDALRAGDVAAAETALRQAESLDPQAPLVSQARQQIATVQASAAAAVASAKGNDASPPADEAGEIRLTVPATSTAPTSGAAHDDIIDLLALADADLKANRLSSPRGNNAIDRYQQVLDRDPGNTRANEGLDAVAARYAALARRGLTQNEFDRAESYLARGRKLRPGLGEWRILAQDLESARRQRTAAMQDASPPPAASVNAAPPVTEQLPAKQEAIALAKPADAQTITMEPTPQPVLPASVAPTVRIRVVGIERDFNRFGLVESEIREAVMQTLRGAGYETSDAGALTLAVILKHTQNTTTGIYSYSTTISAQGSGKNGAAIAWSDGETGIAQDRDLRKIKDILLKHVSAFVAAHPGK